MPISKERLLELALEQLQREKARIDSELQELQAQLSKGAAPVREPLKKRSRPKMSARARKAASERMKKYWAERKKKQAAKKE